MQLLQTVVRPMLGSHDRSSFLAQDSLRAKPLNINNALSIRPSVSSLLPDSAISPSTSMVRQRVPSFHGAQRTTIAPFSGVSSSSVPFPRPSPRRSATQPLSIASSPTTLLRDLKLSMAGSALSSSFVSTTVPTRSPAVSFISRRSATLDLPPTAPTRRSSFALPSSGSAASEWFDGAELVRAMSSQARGISALALASSSQQPPVPTTSDADREIDRPNKEQPLLSPMAEHAETKRLQQRSSSSTISSASSVRTPSLTSASSLSSGDSPVAAVPSLPTVEEKVSPRRKLTRTLIVQLTRSAGKAAASTSVTPESPARCGRRSPSSRTATMASKQKVRRQEPRVSWFGDEWTSPAMTLMRRRIEL